MSENHIVKEPTDRGVLTEKQREFLRQTQEERSENYSPQERYRRQKYIRAQLENAIYDLRLLASNLPENDIENLRDRVSKKEATKAAESFKMIFGVSGKRSAAELKRVARDIESIAEAIENE